MIEIGRKILVSVGGTWSIGSTAFFKKDDGSIDALINGLIVPCKKGFWQALPSTLTETQMVEEAIRFNITALVNNSVVRKFNNDADDTAIVIDDIFDDDYEEETYSDNCDCDSCRAHRGEEI